MRQFGVAQALLRHAPSSRAEEAARQARRFDGIVEAAHPQAGQRLPAAGMLPLRTTHRRGRRMRRSMPGEAQQGHQDFEELRELRRRRSAGEGCREQRYAGMKGVEAKVWLGRRTGGSQCL